MYRIYGVTSEKELKRGEGRQDAMVFDYIILLIVLSLNHDKDDNLGGG